MKKEETKWQVILEWDRWAPKNLTSGKKPTGTDALIFFTYLQKECPHLLTFRTSGDPWQTVHGWLLREGRVSD